MNQPTVSCVTFMDSILRDGSEALNQLAIQVGRLDSRCSLVGACFHSGVDSEEIHPRTLLPFGIVVVDQHHANQMGQVVRPHFVIDTSPVSLNGLCADAQACSDFSA